MAGGPDDRAATPLGSRPIEGPGFVETEIDAPTIDRSDGTGRRPETGQGIVDHDGSMGSEGSKSRKRRHKLDKVPKYEEPNRAEGFSGGSFGRVGHGSDGHHAGKPGRAGSYLLRLLGKKPKGT